MCVIDSVKILENEKVVNEMFSEWLFYCLCFFMLDMVFYKVDLCISEVYDECLVLKEFKYFGEVLCSEFKESILLLLVIIGEDDIMKNDLQGKELMEICVVYF